jgi:hypothetical protein
MSAVDLERLEQFVAKLNWKEREYLKQLLIPTLISLPVEILQKIMKYLPIEFLGKLQQVSKKWYQIFCHDSFYLSLLKRIETRNVRQNEGRINTSLVDLKAKCKSILSLDERLLALDEIVSLNAPFPVQCFDVWDHWILVAGESNIGILNQDVTYTEDDMMSSCCLVVQNNSEFLSIALGRYAGHIQLWNYQFDSNTFIRKNVLEGHSHVVKDLARYTLDQFYSVSWDGNIIGWSWKSPNYFAKYYYDQRLQQCNVSETRVFASAEDQVLVLTLGLEAIQKIQIPGLLNIAVCNQIFGILSRTCLQFYHLKGKGSVTTSPLNIQMRLDGEFHSFRMSERYVSISIGDNTYLQTIYSLLYCPTQSNFSTVPIRTKKSKWSGGNFYWLGWDLHIQAFRSDMSVSSVT